jgi:hypothetical protein
MLAGIPLVIIARYTTKGDFFKQPRVSYDSIEGDESGAPVLSGASR